jgi:hypothetical protein
VHELKEIYDYHQRSREDHLQGQLGQWLPQFASLSLDRDHRVHLLLLQEETGRYHAIPGLGKRRKPEEKPERKVVPEHRYTRK